MVWFVSNTIPTALTTERSVKTKGGEERGGGGERKGRRGKEGHTVDVGKLDNTDGSEICIVAQGHNRSEQVEPIFKILEEKDESDFFLKYADLHNS